MKLKHRLTLAILLIAIVPLALVSASLHLSHRRALTRSILAHLHSTASVQQARVLATLQHNAERLALVASRTQLRLSFAEHQAGGDPLVHRLLTRILNDAADSIDDVAGIALYDTAGVLAVATDDAPGDRHPPDPDLLAAAHRGPLVDRIYRDDQGRPGAFLAGPMTLGEDLIGVVVMWCRLEPLLEALADVSGLGATGETVVARPLPDGRYEFLAPTRFLPDATLTVFAPLPEGRAGTTNPFTGADAVRFRDYRGEPVLAVGNRVAGTDWVVVVKMDHREALASLRRSAALTVVFVLALGAVVVFATLRFARGLSLPLEELAVSVDAIAGGDYAAQAPVRSADEVGALARGFNTMASSVAASRAGLEEKIAELNNEIRQRKLAESDRERLIAELTQALTELKSLKGIIPICASCKKIRDDQGYWNQLEAYLSEHSEALFSHCLCPECLRRYEAQLDDHQA